MWAIAWGFSEPTGDLELIHVEHTRSTSHSYIISLHFVSALNTDSYENHLDRTGNDYNTADGWPMIFGSKPLL